MGDYQTSGRLFLFAGMNSLTVETVIAAAFSVISKNNSHYNLFFFHRWLGVAYTIELVNILEETHYPLKVGCFKEP